MLNIFAIFKIIKPEFSIANNIIKPLIAVILMMISAYFTYQVAGSLTGAPALNKTVTFLPQSAPITPLTSDAQLKVAISLFAAISVGAIIYFAAIWLLKAIKKDDISTITKHE